MALPVIGVVGLGFLGRGIAACLVAYDCRVVAYARSAQSHKVAIEYIQTAMQELVERAEFPRSLLTDWRNRITFVCDLSELAKVEFVIESVSEDLAVKKQVFEELELHLASTVPIASNTSSLPISMLAAGQEHPERFLGMHWAEPAYATRFLELIRGDATSDEAFEKAISLAKQVGKEPSIVQKDVPAFIVNRLGYAMYREAMHLVESGVADVATVDRSFRNAVGLWAAFAGPFRWMDLTGGPELYGKAMQNVLPSLSNDTGLPSFMQELMQADAKGVVNGRGFYEYSEQDTLKWEARFREAVWQIRQWTEKWQQEDQ